MMTRLVRFRIVFFITLFCSALLLTGPTDARAAPGATYDYGWRDDFATTNLNPNWAWAREDNTAWSLSANPGFLQITTQQGFLLGSGGDAQNLLLQAAPAGNYQITTQVFYEPTANFQVAGLLLYQDDDNFLMLGRAYCDTPTVCVGNGLYFDHEEAATTVGGNFATTTTELDEAYLRVVRSGNSYSGYYSEDGTTWSLMGTHATDAGFTPRIGLATDTSGQPIGDIRNADFEFFQLEANFPALPLSYTDNFAKSKLDKRWSWINEDNTHWNLTARPGFLRVTTQPTFVNNMLLQVAPFQNYQITTQIDFNPAHNFEIAGLLLYQDDNNHLVLGHAFCGFGAPTCAGNGIYFDHIEGGNFTGSNFGTAFANTIAYLRVVREGDTYSGFYSEDGTTWDLVGQHTVAPGFEPKVGLLTRGSATGGDPEINADYDSFAAACAVMDKPGQMAPLNNAITTKTKVTLSWYGTPCAPKFQVQLRQDNKKTGALLIDKQVNTIQVKTPTLLKGHTYFWRVRACNGATCGMWTMWYKFKVQ